jgi:heme/copper-type cytochrome/quinol oxidase subunit 4
MIHVVLSKKRGVFAVFHRFCGINILFINFKKLKIMLNNLPTFISIFFVLTTVLTIFLFAKSMTEAPQYKTVLGVIAAWSIIQMALSLTGFYLKTDTLPPRFAFAIVPTLLLIIGLFVTRSSKNFIESLDLKALTYMSVVRIPVELTLLWLFQNGQIPEVMTFEGRNFDIFSGITAPFIAYYGFEKKALNSTVMLIWNFICLGLLVNIVAYAIISAPTPLQQMAFDQPNRGILYFPFVWLPSVIVPLVLLAHLVSIKRLLKK